MSDTYSEWIGRENNLTDHISIKAIEALAATLDLDSVFKEGDSIPEGWHWLFFNSVVKQSKLGTDGHPARGGFLPPIDKPRRMWAGSRIRYLNNLPIGVNASRVSKIINVVKKQGASGEMWFVTVEHSTIYKDIVCIIEEQDLVYRDPAPTSVSVAATGKESQIKADWSSSVTPCTTMLFRYSALTFNGHRIHYDQSYAKNEENYPDLVVHGPLTSTLLQQKAVEHNNGKELVSFDFRGTAPLFVNRLITLNGRQTDTNTMELWALDNNGVTAMKALAKFS